ncbi:MAG: hypothetical protein PHN33_04220 [Candidatus Peribacteraceae bacterium]|nr:hypothetical protein [Candidatus Peribacteraceae bacterium]
MATETPAEAVKTSPETSRDVTQQVNDFLNKLKTDVEQKTTPADKKEIVRLGVGQLSTEQREELSKRMEEHKEGIPRELLEDLIGVLDVTDERKAALKADIESGSDKKKPEGWMVWAGDQMKSGTEKVGQWTDWLMGKTKSGVGFGWDKTVEGLKTAGEWMMSIWSKIEGSIGKVRAGIAIALGGVVAKMEKFLPVWLKDGFNMIVGNYGVFYATINRLGVKIKEGATQVAQGAQEQVQASVDTFSKIYDQAKAWGNTALDFPSFILEVANRLKVQKTSLEFTMAEMVAMAGIVAGEKQVIPAAPVVAPGVAPSAAIAGVAAAPGIAPAAVPEQLARKEVQSLTVNGVDISQVEEKGEKLLKMGEKNYRVNAGVPVSVTKIEELSDGSVAFTGTVAEFLPDTISVTKKQLESVVDELKRTIGSKKIEVTYRNSKNEEIKKKITFEVIVS